MPELGQTQLEKDVFECWRDYTQGKDRCLFWEDGKGFPPDQTFMIYSVRNGDSMSFGNGLTVPLHSDMVLCAKHRAEWKAQVGT